MTKITTTIASERYRDTRGAKCWAKHVTRIDPSKTNGYAFVGDWVRLDRSIELPVDAAVLVFEGMNTAVKFSATIRVLQATERGMAEIERLDTSDRGWALAVRPIVEGLLGETETFYRVLVSEDQLHALTAVLAGDTLEGVVADPAGSLEGAIVAVTNAEEVR